MAIVSLGQLERFRKIIQAVHPNIKVLIHCSTGRGRAATFGAAYWIMRGSSATEAIKSIEKAGYQDWETPERRVVLGEVRRTSESRGATKRKRFNDMMPNQLREKPGRLVLVAGVLREFRRL